MSKELKNLSSDEIAVERGKKIAKKVRKDVGSVTGKDEEALALAIRAAQVLEIRKQEEEEKDQTQR